MQHLLHFAIFNDDKRERKMTGACMALIETLTFIDFTSVGYGWLGTLPKIQFFCEIVQKNENNDISDILAIKLVEMTKKKNQNFFVQFWFLSTIIVSISMQNVIKLSKTIKNCCTIFGNCPRFFLYLTYDGYFSIIFEPLSIFLESFVLDIFTIFLAKIQN